MIVFKIKHDMVKLIHFVICNFMSNEIKHACILFGADNNSHFLENPMLYKELINDKNKKLI